MVLCQAGWTVQPSRIFRIVTTAESNRHNRFEFESNLEPLQGCLVSKTCGWHLQHTTLQGKRHTHTRSKRKQNPIIDYRHIHPRSRDPFNISGVLVSFEYSHFFTDRSLYMGSSTFSTSTFSLIDHIFLNSTNKLKAWTIEPQILTKESSNFA